MTKIKIKPKLRQDDTIKTVEREREREREREQGQEREENCCDEIRKLRREMETMKTEIAEMKQYLREIQKKEEIIRITDDAEVVIIGGKQGGDVSDFSEWMNGLEMVSDDLEDLFQSKDIIEWACHFIIGDLNKKKCTPIPYVQ